MKKLTTIFASVVLIAFGLISTAVASNISKTFEFGPGTQNPSSNVRTYPVPCGRQVAAVVKFKRLGPAAASSDIPINIEFREPDTAPNQEGPIIETRSANAKTTEQTVTILGFSGGSSRGCSLPWRVRVRHANAGTPPFAVTGTSRLDYDGRATSIESYVGEVVKNSSKTENLGDRVAGLQHGKIEVTARWESGNIFVGDIILRFQLIDPSGTVVQTAQGYSSASGSSPKFKLTYQVPTCAAGQWKLKVTNTHTTEGVIGVNPTVQFTPGCP